MYYSQDKLIGLVILILSTSSAGVEDGVIDPK